jgi:hypothetical protein
MTEWRDSADDAPDYGLVLPFIDQSPEFCHGFECGVQYARMTHGRDDAFEQAVHTENLGQIRAAATQAGWSARFEPLDDTWSVMHARRL